MTKHTSDELISKASAVEALVKTSKHITTYQDAIEAIYALPDETPKEKSQTKYEYWAWMNITGRVVSGRFKSRKQAMEWKRENPLLCIGCTLFGKIAEEEE